MITKAWALVLGLILLSNVPAAHADQHRAELKDGVQTTVVTAEEGRMNSKMRIRVTGGAYGREWKYKDQWLDREVDAPVEIRHMASGKYLFVHTYSGGTSCCWSLLVFELNKGNALGELLKGYSPINLVKDGEGSCPIGAMTVPQRIEYSGTNEGKLFRYCFDGARFRKMGRSISVDKPAG